MRKAPITRRTPLRSGSSRRRKPRTKQERERIYGTEAHQAWLRSHPCLVCSRGPVELAHTENGGMGRKADARTLVPICAPDHRLLHTIGVKAFEARFSDRLCGRTLKEWAGTLADAWEKRC